MSKAPKLSSPPLQFKCFHYKALTYMCSFTKEMKNGNVLSYVCGGRKSQIELLEGLAPSENKEGRICSRPSTWLLSCPFHSCLVPILNLCIVFTLYVILHTNFPFLEEYQQSQIRVSPNEHTLIAQVESISKIYHILKYQGLKIQYMKFGGTQFTTEYQIFVKSISAWMIYNTYQICFNCPTDMFSSNVCEFLQGNIYISSVLESAVLSKKTNTQLVHKCFVK